MAGNSFEADPHLTRRGAEVMRSIAEQANALVNDLARYQAMLTGWAGVDDEYAKQVGPQIRKTFKQTTNSGKQVIGAIVSVVEKTAGSAGHVEKARDDAFQGIAAESAEYGGRH
ncbi:hypothetical protein [Streptomyces antibioticus]|uniref:hypothetical protein n=1 Tax=Streptomyces antibioticus TaxID=1890 RepID=UPI0036D97563